ncbi:hypothetical protein M404DRAFT_529453 [Pisolithus tinctorius Marx 270]|uniref:Uncharacterized protein n=1 Tax=Pisolithus tinctorius Marx 270 TaxID=870435 RepID=A0A0C3PAL9_PISTI|nr:hypothetical protein M404DRAFT_529453 [Pisolithus tinctorius Marx 270]
MVIVNCITSPAPVRGTDGDGRTTNTTGAAPALNSSDDCSRYDTLFEVSVEPFNRTAILDAPYKLVFSLSCRFSRNFVVL